MPKSIYILLLISLTILLSACNYTGVTNRVDSLDSRGLPVRQSSVAIQINYIPVCRVTPGRFPAPRRGDQHRTGADQVGMGPDWAMILEGQRVDLGK